MLEETLGSYEEYYIATAQMLRKYRSQLEAETEEGETIYISSTPGRMYTRF